jgi:hypothetical protein
VPPRGRPTGDPRLKTYDWDRIKRYWQRQARPDCEATHCLLPGVPIRYTGPRGPDSLDVGHRNLRADDTRTTWTIDDTRPEHARCNRKAGSTAGHARRAAMTAAPRPATAARW